MTQFGLTLAVVCIERRVEAGQFLSVENEGGGGRDKPTEAPYFQVTLLQEAGSLTVTRNRIGGCLTLQWFLLPLP